MNATTIKTRSRNHRKAKAIAIADATLALGRAEALQRIEAVLTKDGVALEALRAVWPLLDAAERASRIKAMVVMGNEIIAELEAIQPLLAGHDWELLADVLGAKRCGSHAWVEMLEYLANELR